MLLVACQKHTSLISRQQNAERQIERISQVIASHHLDSLRDITRQTEDIYFYIYHDDDLVFWSENSLTIRQVTHKAADEWFEQTVENAKGLFRWTEIEDYSLLTALPVEWEIKNKDILHDSFSFHALQDNEESVTSLWDVSRLRAYYFICISLIFAFVVVGIFGLIRAKGFRNLRLIYKILYLVVTLMLISFVYIFLMSVQYVRRHYEQRQINTLQNKAVYIQSALQNMYLWNYSLTSTNTPGLTIDLQDLAYTYATDINVYDLQGRLVASSTPQLFEQGVLSTLINPDVLYDHTLPHTGYEHLGSIQYLNAYIEFINSSYVRIGYISVPSFISQDEINSEVDSFLTRLLPPYIIIMVLALLISIVVVHSLTKPLSALSERMSSFRLGNRDNHIHYAYQDEVGELVNRYNAMVDELETSAKRIARSEREGAWRTMARQIAHEINNPLTPMKLTIQQLQRVKGTERFDAAFDKASAMLIEQIDTLSRIATSFSTFAKMPEVQIDEVAICEKLTDAISLHATNTHRIPIRYVGPDTGLIVEADKEQIGQVFTNIIRNAIQALGDKPDGDIIVVLKDLNDQIEISVSDNGPGIPEEIQEKIFTPNFTTKTGGSGLGLAISKNIVEGAGGHITFTTSNKGTTFYIYLKKSKQSK